MWERTHYETLIWGRVKFANLPSGVHPLMCENTCDVRYHITNDMQIGSHLAHEPSRVSQVKCSLITAVQSRHVFGFIPRHLCRCEQLQPGVNGLDDESNTEIVTGATVRRVSGLYEKFTLLVSLFQASIWALNRRRGDAHKPDRNTVLGQDSMVAQII